MRSWRCELIGRVICHGFCRRGNVQSSRRPKAPRIVFTYPRRLGFGLTNAVRSDAPASGFEIAMVQRRVRPVRMTDVA
jgi:hypothetical protein